MLKPDQFFFVCLQNCQKWNLPCVWNELQVNKSDIKGIIRYHDACTRANFKSNGISCCFNLFPSSFLLTARAKRSCVCGNEVCTIFLYSRALWSNGWKVLYKFLVFFRLFELHYVFFHCWPQCRGQNLNLPSETISSQSWMKMSTLTTFHSCQSLTLTTFSRNSMPLRRAKKMAKVIAVVQLA